MSDAGEHIVPAEQLAAALRELPTGSKVQTNSMCNLVVLDPTGEYIGYIDFGEDCNPIMIEGWDTEE